MVNSTPHFIHTSSVKKIFTWHVHGSYLYYLTQAPHIFYIPVDKKNPKRYLGRTPNFAWGNNLIEVDVEDVRHLELDVIIFQSKQQLEKDQFDILSSQQRKLPKLYIEHDPPREHPHDMQHPATIDPTITIVHVTHFNDLMWDNGNNRTIVVDHGVIIPDGVKYTGELAKGIVVINNLKTRGRRLGADIFEYARKQVPLDLVGINSKEMGGIGEVPLPELPQFMSQYRFFFNPIRYTSLGLSLCEAMMTGLPIVALKTTEVATAIQNDMNGYAYTNLHMVIQKMKELLYTPTLAQRLSQGAQEMAHRRFSIERFISDWNAVFSRVCIKEKIVLPI